MQRAFAILVLINGLLGAMQPGIEMSAKKVALITQAKDKIVMFSQIQEAADWLWQAHYQVGYNHAEKLAKLRVFLYQKSADGTSATKFTQKHITQLDNIRDFIHIRYDNFVWRHVLASQNPVEDDLVILGTKDPIILQRLRRLLEKPTEYESKYCLKLLAPEDNKPRAQVISKLEAQVISELEKVNACSISWY